jgi:hypothetical protein
MSKKEREEYYNWYMGIMPERLKDLFKLIKHSKEYDAWLPDYTSKSLEILGQWFSENVQTRKNTKGEIAEIYAKSPGWFKSVEIEDWDLTEASFSLAFDIGLYIGNVFIKNNSELSWFHVNKGRKDYSNYGQPVIDGFKNGGQFNPTRIMIVLAYSLADGTQDGSRLKELYDYWSNLCCPSP